MKSLKTLVVFSLYCLRHPSLRFWQALLGYVSLTDPKAKMIVISRKEPMQLEVGEKDTFYRE